MQTIDDLFPLPVLATLGLAERGVSTNNSSATPASIAYLDAAKERISSFLLNNNNNNSSNGGGGGGGGAGTGTGTSNKQTAAFLWDFPPPAKSLALMAVSRTDGIFRTHHLDKNFVFAPLRKTSAGSSLGTRQGSIPSISSHQSLPLPNSSSSLHSPLSPLNTTSPLYPDGIIHPFLWTRKYSDPTHDPSSFIPAVCLAFYDLWERVVPIDRKDPLGVQQAMSMDRERDLILCSEINERRRVVQEKGIKFALVIILKLAPVDSLMEERLTFIRKTCQLENRGLFVINPIKDLSSSELPDFLVNVQRSLFEYAVNFYRDITKRLKKKKQKNPSVNPSHMLKSAPTSAPPPNNNLFGSLLLSDPSSIPAKPLPLAGWNIRYEFKLGHLAEIRQEYEVAVRHFDACYQGLIEIFGNAGKGVDEFIRPNTARWDEAKVLVDLVSFKIIKLYLYLESPTQAIVQFNKHLSNMICLPEFKNITAVTSAAAQHIDLLTGGMDLMSMSSPNVEPNTTSPTSSSSSSSTITNAPGIDNLLRISHGGGSFRFWAWASTQYRTLGEIIESALSKRALQVPYPPLGSAATPSAAVSILNTISNTGMNVISGGDVPIAVFGPYSAVNPAIMIQHPGFFFLTAARCTEQRWVRYRQSKQNPAAMNSMLVPLIAPPPPTMSAQSNMDSNFLTRSGNGSFQSYQPNTITTTTTISAANSTTAAEEDSLDHASLVIDHLTKAYEHFKRQKSGRTALFIASSIARVYEESNRPEMALKFYDRISKTYRKEGWSVILASLLVAMKRCAKKVGFLDVAIECLVEMLHVELTPRYEQRLSVLQELLGIVDGKIVSETGSWTFGKRGLGRQASLGPSTSSSSTASMMLAATLNNTAAVCSPFEASSSSSNFPGTPSSKNNAVTVSPSFVAIDMDQINSFLVCAVQFEKASTYVGAPVRFQVTIEAVGDQTPPASLRIARVEIIFSDPDYDHCITDKTAVAHSEADFSDHEIIMGKGGSLQWIDCTNCAKSDNLIGSNAGSSGGSGSKSFWTKAVNLELRPGLTNIFEGVVNPTCGMDLKIVNVSAVVESVGGMFTLDFRVSERPENTIKKRKWLEITQGLPKFILKDGFGELTSLRVVRRTPNVVIGIVHSNPAYLDELYPIKVSFTNNERVPIHAIGTFEFKIAGTEGTDPTSDISSSLDELKSLANKKNAIIDHNLGVLAPGSGCERTVWVSCTKSVADRLMVVTMSYRNAHSSGGDASFTTNDVNANQDSFFQKIESYRIPFKLPFELSFTSQRQIRCPLSSRQGGLDDEVDSTGLLAINNSFFSIVQRDIFALEEHLVVAAIKVNGPWDIVIKNVEFISADSKEGIVLEMTRVKSNGPIPQVIDSTRSFNALYKLKISKSVPHDAKKVALGKMQISWKRKINELAIEAAPTAGIDDLFVTSTLPIPQFELASDPILVLSDVSGSAIVGSPLTVTYTCYNMTLRMVEVTSAVEASDAFLYSGYKTCSFKVLPLASHVLKFTLLPLTGGNCLLPRLKLREASAVANSTSSSSAAVAANGTLPSTTSPSDASVIKKGDREGSASSTTAANTTTTTTASDTVLKINYSWDDLTVFVRPRIEE